MTDKLKPVCCGCGGEAKAMSNDSHLDGCIFHFVKCAECGIDTAFYDTEAEAITAWNKAMSGNVQKCAKDAQCSKRTTKVPYCPEKYYCDDALKLMVMNIFGDYIYATDDIDLEKLREALNTLLERDQRIMFMRYQNCETLENIGKEFGVTRERIRQIIARALRILRHPKFEIAKAKPAEPERKWIPVSEALPEEDGKLTGYLVSIGYDVTIMCFVDGKFVSWTFADNKLVEKQFPVSAWMPLPEPYRGEE